MNTKKASAMLSRRTVVTAYLKSRQNENLITGQHNDSERKTTLSWYKDFLQVSLFKQLPGATSFMEYRNSSIVVEDLHGGYW